MDLSTKYLGLDLAHPLMPGASPLLVDLDTVRQLEDAGAAALVMHSLFEEQIEMERSMAAQDFLVTVDSLIHAMSFYPVPSEYAMGSHDYLEQIRRIKDAVGVPLIASLNGVTPTGWLSYARLIEQAGADALELNVYFLPSDPSQSGETVEQRVVDIVKLAGGSLRIPIAVKLLPFYSSLPHLAARLAEAGARGLVLFNQPYQPDIDIDDRAVTPHLRLTESSDLRLRLRWLAALSGRVATDLAVSGGVHSATDAAKALMAGAHAVQMVAALLKHGPAYLTRVKDDLVRWIEQSGFDSLEEMRGCMNLTRCADPSAYERANYVHILQSWRRE